MKKSFIPLLFILVLLTYPARGDMFGGDVAVLAQILANALEQLAELKSILDSTSGNLELVREINRGINDSMKLARTIHPSGGSGIYGDWRSLDSAMNRVNGVFGAAPLSNDQQIFRDTDQNVAEAVTLNNSIYDYAEEIDEIGEAVKEASHEVSPGGAEKLTAQTLGVMLHVMNASLRAQATGLKLQAHSMELQNKKEKDSTREYLTDSDQLKSAMKNEVVQFQAPRF